jgi:cobaltochelatase CobT
MKKPSDNPTNHFKKALAEATKTMSGATELTVTYSIDPSGVTKDTMRLPQVSRRMSIEEVLLARGTADAFAMRLRHHNEALANRYAPKVL